MIIRAIPFALIAASILAIQNCKTVDVAQSTTPPPIDTTTYSCAGKTTCSEMKSCNEAKFYLQNCPGVSIDGDGDGIPCEDQWCH
jgi:hypothetical protein